MEGEITPAVKAEAAAWLARLHADDRSADDERAFRAWLADDPAHSRAFDTVTMVWDVTGALRGGFPRAEPARLNVKRRAVLASMATLAVAGGTFGFIRSAYAGVYETDVGGQEHVALEDGTEAFLDTDTRIRVHYSDDVRAVHLDRGRVNFRVAPDPLRRPFVVDAAERRIVATQTTFDVRRDGDDVSVVLIHGNASVIAKDAPAPSRKVLSTGERLVATATAVHVDKPNLVPLTAWQFGQAMFENQTLADAAAEMNRYSTMKLEVVDPAAARLRLSGVYRVGDTAAFARSVASLLPVQVIVDNDAIEIVADPTRMRAS